MADSGQLSHPAFIILIPGFAADASDVNCLPFQQSFILSVKRNFPALKIVILSFQYPYTNLPNEWNGIQVIPFGGKNRGGLSKLLLRQKLYRKLKCLHKQNRITGLLSFWYGECALVGNRFEKKYMLPHFCWLMGQDAKPNNNYPDSVQLPGSKLVALSDFLQKEFEKNHGVKPAHVIPPGLENLSSNQKERPVHILAAGSLIPLKQFDIIIGLVAMLRNRIPGVKAIIAGDGPERKSLQDKIGQTALKDSITLAGELPHTDLQELMQRSRVFIHPSSYEGFGMVCLEALRAGAEVISFVQPMNKKIEGWHIVKSFEEMGSLAAALLLDNNSTNETALPFHIDETAKKVMALYPQNF